MELKRISYSSAVAFGLVALVVQVISGILQVVIDKAVPGYFTNLGIAVEPMQTIIVGPIILGVLVYLILLFVFWIYNNIAKKYPIRWELNHK